MSIIQPSCILLLFQALNSMLIFYIILQKSADLTAITMLEIKS